jgi:CheY-like chemotaxis protein
VSQGQSISPLRILYIEDNELVREITCELLATNAREVVAVSTGEEALHAFQESRFDIVVTDVSLPEMSGIDLARHVLKIAPSVPVILATGYALDLDDCRLGPTVRTIAKPFDGPALDALIHSLCGARAPI